jgi:hypothetical protein
MRKREWAKEKEFNRLILPKSQFNGTYLLIDFPPRLVFFPKSVIFDLSQKSCFQNHIFQGNVRVSSNYRVRQMVAK